MTHQEMQQHFPGRKRLELVTLIEHDGERMWQRESDGWYRLNDQPAAARG
jgi:hypothetical protein